jgi:ferredoxin-NADP reductase
LKKHILNMKTKEYKLKILKIDFVTPDVKRFVFEKPKNYKFIPGQAVDTSINNNELKKEKRPFTFTSKNTDLVLEFTMKRYDGMTKKFHELNPGDEIIIGEPFGTINYKGEGTFIAGGAGITPFISILRSLGQDTGNNRLIFSNKTRKDVIYSGELSNMLEKNVKFVITDEKVNEQVNERIDYNFLKREINQFNQYFYICGPPAFVTDVKSNLIKLGAKENRIITEK